MTFNLSGIDLIYNFIWCPRSKLQYLGIIWLVMNSFDFFVSDYWFHCCIWIMNNKLFDCFMRNFHLCRLLRSNVYIIRILYFNIIYIESGSFCGCWRLIIYQLISIRIWIWTNCLYSTNSALNQTIPRLRLNWADLNSLGNLLLYFRFYLLLT